MLCLGKTNTGVAKVEDCVVGAHEYITKDPEWANLRWQIELNEARNALSLITSAHNQDVVLGSQSKVGASNNNIDVGECWDLVALNSRLIWDKGVNVCQQ